MSVEEAVDGALAEVEKRIRGQAKLQKVGSMAWRAHMADIIHVQEVRREAA